MTHKNEEGRTIMEENTENKRTNQALLSMAMSALNDSHNLIPEVRREIVKAENEEGGRGGRNLNQSDSKKLQELDLILALFVLADVINLAEGEERRTTKTPAIVLPELINI